MFPFYDDFMKGYKTEARAKTQIYIVADFIKTQGDLSLLRNLWARVSSFTNYQAIQCDFGWGKKTHSKYLCHRPYASRFGMVPKFTIPYLGYLRAILQPRNGGFC